MSKSGKFVLGLTLAGFVIAVFAVTPAPAADVPANFETIVRVLGVLTGTWLASHLMYPFLLGRR